MASPTHSHTKLQSEGNQRSISLAHALAYEAAIRGQSEGNQRAISLAHALAYEAAARHALESAHGPPLVPCLEDLDAHLIRRHSIVIRGQ